jgi:hypothetical protein
MHMKVLLGLLVVAGGLYAALHFGGMFSFDPIKQANDTKAGIKVGMSWQAVNKAGYEPRKWRIYNTKKQTVEGHEIVMYVPGPEVPFEGNNIESRLKDGSLPGGFEYVYDFHAGKGGAFNVKFDANGDVEGITDAITMGTLLNP